MISLYKNNFELHAEGAGEVRQRGETPLSLEDEGHTKIGCERHPKWVGKCISNHPTSRCAPGDLVLPRLLEMYGVILLRRMPQIESQSDLPAFYRLHQTFPNPKLYYLITAYTLTYWSWPSVIHFTN